jgi:hypothetical protein
MKTRAIGLTATAWLLGAFVGSLPAQTPPILDIQGRPGSVELRWRPSAGSPPGQLLTFQLESSDDLLQWSPIGPTVRAASADELHLRSFASDRARAFYRLLARYDAVAKAALASGGAEVFGYGSAFAAELKKVGQITPDQFAAKYPFPNNYLDHVSFEVTQAKFFADFDADPAVVNATRIPDLEPIRATDFRLSAEELGVFKKNGFVVSERQAMPSFADQFYRIWKDDMPVYVSTDAILHAWHRTYDAMLEELEETFLYENLDRLLDGMAGKLAEAAGQVGNGVLKDSALDADYFLAVARTLLKGKPAPSALGQDARVAKTLEAIRAEEPELDTCFNLFGAPRAVDFSQFKVRGHYENSPRLGRYFQSVMWLGRTDLRLAGGPFQDSDCTEPHPAPPRELGTALVLNWLLNQSGQFERWRQFEQIIQVFIGWTDSATFAHLGELLKAAKIAALTDLPDLAALLRLQEQIVQGQIGVQNIHSDSFISPLGREQSRLPQSFTVFGQKFVPDSWALAQSVFDSIIWEEDGKPGPEDKVRRRVPSALDVAFSTLGNNQTVPELLGRLKDQTPARHPFRDGFNYQHNLAAVRGVMDGQGPGAWTSNLYMDWLGTLRELSKPLTDPEFPQALRTKAWAMKSLNTQLASWSQLRHDTILYAKQSYTGGAACEFPAVLVEPHPTFWTRMREMVERTRQAVVGLSYEGKTRFAYRPIGNTTALAEWEALAELDPGALDEQQRRMLENRFGQGYLSAVKTRQVAHLARFIDALRRVEQIVQLQRQGGRLSENPLLEAFACDLIQQQIIPSGCTVVRSYDGWYPQLFYRSILHERNEAFHEDTGVGRFDAIVADVHTDVPSLVHGDPGSVLHEGIGPVNMAFIAVEFEGQPVMFAGPVLSHFEFELIGPPRRLSDSLWEAAISGGEPIEEPLRPEWRVQKNEWGNARQLPPTPPWTRDYLVPIRP